MRWFKHLAGFRGKTNVAAYLDACERDALAGYGFLMAVLEVICEQITPDSNNSSVTYSNRQWSRLLGCHVNRVGKYMGKLGGSGIVDVEFDKGTCTVRAPMLLKLRDEYSRKSGHSPDTVRTMSHQNRSDTDKEQRESRNKSCPLPQDFRLSREMQSKALKIAPGINVDSEFEAFLAYSKANAKAYDDWEAAFERWCHKSKEFSPGGGDPGEGELSREEKLDRHGQDLGISRRQHGESLDDFHTRIGKAQFAAEAAKNPEKVGL